jgi:[ribosomal protein S5]-alanine N-acetyltransferase
LETAGLNITETARLRLRLLTLEDARFIHDLYSDPDFIRNIGDRGVHSIEAARRYLEVNLLASYAQHGFGLYMVERKDPPIAVGICGLLRRDTHEDVEIGFAMLPGFRRQGYTLEAARAVMQLGFGTLGLTRIVAITAPANLASIRILEMLGMKHDGQVFFSPGGSESSFFVLDSAGRV